MGIIIFIIIVVGAIIIYGYAKEQAKNSKKKNYRNALEMLKKDPNNPNMREKVLELGRIYAQSVKDKKGKNDQFGELALTNDINAAIAGSTAKVEVTNAAAISGKSVAEEIERLGQLFLAGVVTAEEFERGKTLFLGAPADKVTSAVELLQNLYNLKKKGVLSESEFNMKKWEILSERQLPGKSQSAKL
jgi:Short C-terminal domain